MKSKLISATIFILLAFGCITKKKCDEKCRLASLSTKDSVYVSSDTTKKDSLYTKYKTIEVSGPVRWLPNPCANLCDSLGKLKPIDMVEHKNGMTTEIKSVGDSLEFLSRADSLQELFDKQTTLINNIKSSISEKIKPIICTKQHRTKLDTLCGWVTILFFLILAIFVSYKVAKFIYSRKV